MVTKTDEITTGRMVLPPGPLAWEPPAPPRRQRWAWVAAPVLLLVVAVAASALITIPYYALSPGSARPVGDLITVPADQRHVPRGQVLLTTVSLRKVTILEALQGVLDPDIAVYEQEAILGDSSRDEYRQQNVQLMEDSKQVAAVVAMRRLGYTVTEKGDGAIIADVGSGSPVAGRLAVGETVVGVEGRPTPLKELLVEEIRARRPGATIGLDVERSAGGTRRTETIRLGRLVNTPQTSECVPIPAEVREADGEACIGVLLQTRNRSFDMPFDVVVESGAIGGPSAGLAFSLGVLDVLRPGELTGGKKVAVTGTIELDGTVGDVGGVNQKTAAALSQGVDVFLVPPGEYAEARRRARGQMTVLRVGTLEEAIAALARVGGETAALGPRPGA